MDYSDVKANGWIQPYKLVYTMADFHRLHKHHDALTARFILLCSAVYYSREKGLQCRTVNTLDNVQKFLYMDPDVERATP